MSADILPWRSRDTETEVEPTAERLGKLEAGTRDLFRAALEQALESSAREAARLLPETGCDVLMRIVSKVVREESDRFIVF